MAAGIRLACNSTALTRTLCKKSGQLAQAARTDLQATDPPTITESPGDDQHIPRQHHQHQPAGNEPGQTQADEAGNQQQLVRQRIEQGSEPAAPAETAGEKTVQRIAGAGQDEQQQGLAVSPGEDRPGDRRHQQKAQQGQQVGQAMHGRLRPLFRPVRPRPGSPAETQRGFARSYHRRLTGCLTGSACLAQTDQAIWERTRTTVDSSW